MNLKLLMKVGRRLARPDIFFYCGLYMMALLIAGTISQKYIGLYQARHTFFSSFVFWFYGLPLPGGRAAMGLILISLLLKTVYSLPTLKTRQKLGSFIMHLGVIWLLTGAFITGVFSQEGYMVLKEGEKSSVLLDYHKVELSILLKGAAFGAVSTSRVVDNQLEKANKNRAKVLKAFHEQILIPNKVLTGPFPFTIHIQQFMKNARKADDKVRPKKLEKISEENQAGLLFHIYENPSASSAGAQTDRQGAQTDRQGSQTDRQGSQTTSPSAVKKQSYALFEPVPETIKVQDQEYIARLQPARTYLPFSLKLIDFKKQLYPGSDKAKAYQSLVHTLDRGITGRRLIKMNHPLRYKGYTFYQSSYIESDQGEISVLSVVKNAGQAFPYISSLLICLGLLIYICFMKKIF